MDFIEMTGHFVYTWLAVILTNWAVIGGGILMLMQGIYLFYKIRKAKKDSEE